MDPLLAAALDTLGIVGPVRPLTPHHSRAWRVGDWKVKAATTAADIAPLIHDARAVALLHARGLYPGAGAYGQVGDGVWTAIEWRAGSTLWDWCRVARDRYPADDVAARLRHIGRQGFARLAELHAAGWHHGDIQPANILVTPGDGIEFIDYDFAQHPDLPLPYPYRGGMDHATAPEIAQRLLDTRPEVHIPLTDVAEVYSFGASLRWSWTGCTPATTRTIGPAVTPTDILKDITTGHHRGPLPIERPWPDPILEALIASTTSLDPADRTATAALDGT
ncbi:hypothetical protein [Embleya sp. NBC_00896]|uniref:hypothetical protein n=1 Tax=Embleya sp. NBC_00896 TaxID=2975961 RepID=UPI002F90E2CE|nr:hypothetical protein OG928_36915 [Embleya sp. NBC_00896]